MCAITTPIECGLVLRGPQTLHPFMAIVGSKKHIQVQSSHFPVLFIEVFEHMTK